MIDSKRSEELREYWLRMGNEIGFKIIAPYVLNYNNKELNCFAFLPNFGSSRGMILDIIFAPDYETDREISDACNGLGLYFSFISYDSFITADKKGFCDALVDWGYFGEPDSKPTCMI